MISVIVCTYDRNEKLRNLLLELFKQDLANSIPFEVIVIDNKPSVETEKIVSKFNHKSEANFLYFALKDGGLSAARNYGIDCSRGELICFIDDDCLPQVNWMQSYWDLYANKSLDVAVGPVIPLDFNKISTFFRKRICLFWGPLGFFRLNTQGSICFLKSSEILPIGANMSFSRTCLNDLGHFRQDLGMGAGCVGEDTEFFERCLKKNKRIVYDPKVMVMHDTEQNRTSCSFIFKWYLLKVKYLLKADVRRPFFDKYHYILITTIKKISILFFFKHGKSKFDLGLRIQ